MTHDRFVEPIRTSNREFHGRRRKKLLKFAIPVAILVVMALTSIAVDALRPASTALVDVPAEPLNGASDEKEFNVVASEVQRYRFDDASRGDEVTLVVTAVAQDPSIGTQPEVDVRLLQVGTGANGDDLEAGATRSVAPNGTTVVEAAIDAGSSAPGNSTTTSTTKVQQEIIRPIERKYSLPADGSYFIEISANSASSACA